MGVVYQMRMIWTAEQFQGVIEYAVRNIEESLANPEMGAAVDDNGNPAVPLSRETLEVLQTFEPPDEYKPEDWETDVENT
jgi:hypothetical protein